MNAFIVKNNFIEWIQDGYFLTKEFGPRIRLGAVTTDLPLISDKPVDIGIDDFCTICKKCANCCPSKSIPVDEHPKEFNGTLRWKLNADTCYGYWFKVGTDCCICMKVCPWSHARTFPHKLIVWMITRNKLARRLFSFMDDIFYGKKPIRPKDAPQWATYSWFQIVNQKFLEAANEFKFVKTSRYEIPSRKNQGPP